MIFLDFFIGMSDVFEFNRDNQICVLSVNSWIFFFYCSLFEFLLFYLVGFKGEIWRFGSEYGKYIDFCLGKN